MRKFLPITLVVLFTAVSVSSYAQMDKKEAKEWKKRIKALTPEQYKNLLDENRTYKSQVGSLKTELAGFDDRLAEKDNQIQTYQSQVTDLRGQLSAAKEAASTTTRSVTTESADSGEENVGIIFRVQIGAFSKKDMAKFSKSAKNFSVDEGDGIQRYTIGAFRDYWEADTFKKYLREMGVKDAWVASYKDGQRVPIKEVLEGVKKS